MSDKKLEKNRTTVDSIKSSNLNGHNKIVEQNSTSSSLFSFLNQFLKKEMSQNNNNNASNLNLLPDALELQRAVIGIFHFNYKTIYEQELLYIKL